MGCFTLSQSNHLMVSHCLYHVFKFNNITYHAHFINTIMEELSAVSYTVLWNRVRWHWSKINGFSSFLLQIRLRCLASHTPFISLILEHIPSIFTHKLTMTYALFLSLKLFMFKCHLSNYFYIFIRCQELFRFNWCEVSAIIRLFFVSYLSIPYFDGSNWFKI